MNGIVWFECGKGLSTYDGHRMSNYKDLNYNSKNDWKLNDSDIWFKGDEIEGYSKLEGNPGVYQYDGKKLSYRTFPVKTKPGQENHYSISTAFILSKNGMLWFGTFGAVIGYNGSDLFVFFILFCKLPGLILLCQTNLNSSKNLIVIFFLSIYASQITILEFHLLLKTE